MHADHDIFEQRHFLEYANILESAGDATLGNLVRRHLADVFAIKNDLARGGTQQAGNQIEDGSLAGAIRTDQTKDATLWHMELNSLQYLQAAKVLADIVEL